VQNSSVSLKSDEREPIRTDAAIAELANMGKDTIRTTNRAGQYAAAIDAIAKALRQHLHGRGVGFVGYVGSPPP